MQSQEPMAPGKGCNFFELKNIYFEVLSEKSFHKTADNSETWVTIPDQKGLFEFPPEQNCLL